MSDLPNPLPKPTTGPVNRIVADSQSPTQTNGGAATPVPPVPQVISSIEDVLAFLAASHACVVIAVSRKRADAKPGGKPLAVTVLHAGDPSDALKLAQVAVGVVQGA